MFTAMVVLLAGAIFVCISCIRIVPQAQAYVIERLGAYQATWGVGVGSFSLSWIRWPGRSA